MPAVYGQVAPFITSSPTNQTTLPGRTVLLRAAATGTQPLTYQWQLNGTNLAGALGSTLAFSNVKQSDSGAYRVVVTNQAGTATSGAGVLTVVPVAAWGDNRSGQLKVPAEVTNAVRLAVGGTFCLALRADHKVVAWGGNAYGQTNVPATATNIIAVAAGSSHALAVRGDGTVVAWGSHGAGQTNVPAQATNVIAVAAGSSHSVALRRDGSVIAWGSGASVTNVPAGVENIVAIAAGGIHTLALRSDGVVLAWGINTYGQTSVHGGASADVVQIAAGGNHSLALRTDGTVVAWGDNYYGQGNFGFTLNQVAAIAAGNTHSIALKNDGTVVGWGEKPPIFTYVPYGLTNAPAGVSNIVELASAATVNLARIGDGSPQLVAGSVNVSGWQGGKVVLSGMAVGKPPLYYQWFFNGVKVPGATQPSLTLTNLQLAQAGEYSIVVTGPNGVITYIAATVQVLTPPVPMIVTHPASASVRAGTNITFTATAGGIPAVIQWQFNGTNLTGRTGTSLTLTNVQSAEAGEYRVIVSNISGSSTSQVAVLAITPAPPAILTQPQNLIIVPGRAATFAVTARGTTPLAYQWQLNDADITGATSSSLDFPMVQSSDAGSYRVIITNAIGAITSSVATLATVPIAVWGANTYGLKNVLTATSNAVALAAGRDHLLALRADGTVIAWGNNSSGQTTDSPAATNIAAVAAGDGHNLVLRTDGSVFAWGNNANGQLNVPPTASNVLAIAAGSRHNLALRIDGTVVGWGNNSHGQVNIPATATNVIAIAAGDSHSLALHRDGTILGWGDNFWGQRNFPASATGLVALAARDLNSLALRKDGKPIAWGTFRPNTDYPAQATSLVAIAVGNYHSLAVRDDATVVAWGYDFSGETKIPPGLTNVAAIAGGSLFSAAFSHFGPPRLGVKPASRIANAGADVVFHIAAAGALPLTYQWLANGTLLPGATNGSLQLMNVQSSASYQFIVLNQSGSVTSAPIVLTVQPAAPWITAEPVNASAGLGGTASFHVRASGSAPLNFQWLFHGTNLLSGDRIAGATSPSLFISNLNTNDVGPYFVRVSNTFGSVTSQVASLDVALPPEIVQSPTNHTLPAGTNATFSVTATGPPALAYQWRFNLMALVQRTNAFLTFTNVQSVNAGDYDVVVVNPYGAATSDVATLTILPSAPVITLHPTSRSVTAGNGTTFSSRASGSEPLRYQWLFNGVALPGATTINLSIASVETVNAGQYRVVVTNDFGAVTSSIATLSVSASGLTIATQPKDLVVTRGMSASFNVLARGSNPLGYQWQRNGSPIPGATGSSFTLNHAQPENTGAYRVLVNNPSGSLVSSEGVLSVVSVAAWGQSTYGQINVPLNATEAAAVAAGAFQSFCLQSDGSVLAWGNYEPYTSINLPPGLSEVVSLAAGFMHGLALKRDGTVIGWGTGTPANPPPALADVAAVAAGPVYSLALKTDGTLVGWGSGLTHPLPELTNVAAVAVGVRHGLALKYDGTVEAWGSNDSSQTDIPAGLRGVLAIAAGGNHCLALKDDGTVVGWGSNFYGQTNLPVGLSNVVAIEAGDYHSLALKSDGTVAAWGLNTWGQKNVPALLTNVISIAAGAQHSLAAVGDGGPCIATPLFNRTALVGESLTLRTLAVGNELNYHWQFEGTNIAGATNSGLNLDPVSYASAGRYVCIVSNAHGSVTNREISVTVFPPTLRLEILPGGPLTENGFHLRLSGLSGDAPVMLLVSTNLATWDALRTNPPTLGPIEYWDTAATNLPVRYYRALELRP